MRKLLVFLLVLVILVGAGELVAARFAGGEIEERVARRTGAEVQAEVDSFPLVTRLLVTEEVDSVTVTLKDVNLDSVDLETLTIVAQGIKLPRSRLLGRNLKPTGIDEGTVTAFVSSTSLSDAVGVAIPGLDPGSASAQLEAGALTLEIPGSAPVSVPMPQEALPCSGSGKIVEGGVRMRCAVDEIPDILLDNLPG